MPTSTDQISQIHQLEASLQRKTSELQDLATMGTVITSIHEIKKVLSVVMDMSLRLVNGEVGTILLEESGKLISKISWGINENFVNSLDFKGHPNIAGECFETTESMLLADMNLKSPEGLLVNTILAIPIKTSKKCYGVLVIVNKSDETNYDKEDREVLEMLLNFVAVAIDNSELMKDQLEQQKFEQEMKVAREVQETILPANIDIIDRMEIGATFIPAQEVSGDFYDIVKISDTEFFAIMGDVSSKGLPAALVMSAAAGVIKSSIAANHNISVSELASVVNEILSEEIIKERDMFITLFFCRFDLYNNKVTYTNAGHVPALFWDAKEEKIEELKDGGTIIGQFSGIPFKEGERKISQGDRILLFTDGLTEAADSSGKIFGRENVVKLFESNINLSPNEFCNMSKEYIDNFSVGCSDDYIDDFTIMQLRVR